jgi:hypothetical protein
MNPSQRMTVNFRFNGPTVKALGGSIPENRQYRAPATRFE